MNVFLKKMLFVICMSCGFICGNAAPFQSQYLPLIDKKDFQILPLLENNNYYKSMTGYISPDTELYLFEAGNVVPQNLFPIFPQSNDETSIILYDFGEEELGVEASVENAYWIVILLVTMYGIYARIQCRRKE